MAKRDEPATATMARDAPSRAPVAARVRVLGPNAPEPFRLTAGVCRVGTAPGNDLVLGDRTLSRAHAELSLVADGVAVTDLGSRNGTFYLGQRIDKAVLALGAELQLGNVRVVVEPDVQALMEVPPYERDELHGAVGHSSAMRRLFGVIDRLRASTVTVLLEGESGVGKEVLARAIHLSSPVAKGPMVALNCGAIPRELIASELFGHARGAFTGAHEARRGAFESADGGTLFLDELGELPLDVQPILLRALETGEFRAVGRDEPKHAKVRIIAATNRDLEADKRSGRFREDLFYRVAVVRLTIPPLRTRPEDIEPLVMKFAKDFGVAEVPASAVARFRSKPWPGNVRELRNAVQSFAALGFFLDAEDPRSPVDLALSSAVDVNVPYAEQKDALVERFTKVYLAALLTHASGNQTAAAALAGLDRGYLGKLLERHGIKR